MLGMRGRVHIAEDTEAFLVGRKTNHDAEEKVDDDKSPTTRKEKPHPPASPIVYPRRINSDRHSAVSHVTATDKYGMPMIPEADKVSGPAR